MPNNYDSVAGYYDFLSRLVFGQAEINAQVELLRYIRPGDRVLIVGGGTGWILQKLAAIYPSGLHVTYIEPSAKMMALSKKRYYGQNEIDFVLLPIEQFVTEERYDRILTGFLFDNFSAASATTIFRLLDALLRGGGYWLFADFCRPSGNGRLWQTVLLHSMYLSARVILKVEAKELPDTDTLFSEAGYRQDHLSFHYWGFIQSIAYQKRDDANFDVL